MNTSLGPRRLGQYELRELLGQGGMAEVWKAFDTNLQRYVAIKLLHANLQNDPHFVARFEREARVVAPLHHRNIVKIHDFHISGPPESESLTAYMVMDYIEGPTFAEYIARTSSVKKFPPISDIITLLAAIASSIDYAHQQGVVHRDIKPANILLDQHNRSRNPMGEPMLTDFGIAKLLNSSTGLASGLWLGTELYISPEQAQGYAGNERSDLYAFGVILYEICTGVRPFQGSTPTSIVIQHINMPPPSPILLNPNIPPALAMVILRALAKDPGARFASASAMVAAVAEAFNTSIPGELRPSTSLSMMNEVTHYKPQPAVAVGVTPLSHPTPMMPFTNQMAVNPFTASPFTPPPSSYMPPPAPIPERRRQNKRLMLILTILLLLLLVGSGLGAYALLSHPGTASTIVSNSTVGHVFFVSSGQLQEGNSQGINDELEINLQNIPPPDPGKSYYGWLLADRLCDLASKNPSSACDPKDPQHLRILNPVAPLLLGRLPFNKGNVSFLYMGNQQHSNLIGITSRLLITEENASSTPTSASTDQHTWRYYAELPQTRSTNAQIHTALHTLRNILFESEGLSPRGLHGGIDIRLLRNTEKVLEWANSARDAWSNDPGLLHRQVTRILDYLDGVTLVKEDVPSNTPVLVDAQLAIVPLIDLHQIQVIHSFSHNMDINLSALPRQPGVTPTIGQLALQADQALLHGVENYLGQVHTDAKQLANMTNAQLSLPTTLSILNDMRTWASYALIGRFDLSTGKVQPGVIQIHYSLQQLATFDVKPYTLS